MKAEIIKKYCKTCYWHKYHGCHIDICGPNKCANAVALEEVNNRKG